MRIFCAVSTKSRPPALNIICRRPLYAPSEGAVRLIGGRSGHRYRRERRLRSAPDDPHLALREWNRDAVFGEQTPDVPVHGGAHARRAGCRILDPEAQFEIDAVLAE